MVVLDNEPQLDVKGKRAYDVSALDPNRHVTPMTTANTVGTGNKYSTKDAMRDLQKWGDKNTDRLVQAMDKGWEMLGKYLNTQ